MSRNENCFWRKNVFHLLSLTLLSLLPVVVILSWIVSIYVDDSVNNLLGSNGIRWMVSSIVNNIYCSPLAGVVVFLISLSVLYESGLISTLTTLVRERKWSGGSLSLKKRRALMLSVGVVEVLLVLFVILMLFPGSILYTAFGTYENSALQQGWYGMLALSAILVGNVFGYSSGGLVSSDDFMHAHTSLLSQCSWYILYFCLAAEFVAFLDYSLLTPYIVVSVLSYILYYSPLLYIIYMVMRGDDLESDV